MDSNPYGDCMKKSKVRGIVKEDEKLKEKVAAEIRLEDKEGPINDKARQTAIEENNKGSVAIEK